MTIIEEKRTKVINKITNTNDESLLDLINILTDNNDVDDSDDAGYNEDSFFDRYYDKQFFLDFNGSYAFNKKLRFFAEINNLTNQSLRYYQGEKSRTAQVEYYGPRMNFGLKFDLLK